MKALELNLIDETTLANIADYLETDRYENGLNALVTWHSIGQLWNGIVECPGLRKSQWVDVFTEAVGSSVSKDDRPASGKLADFNLAEIKIWYESKSKFMVSPRSILKAYGTYLKEVESLSKTEIETTVDKIKEAGRAAIAADTKALEEIAKLMKLVDGINDRKTLSVIANSLSMISDTVDSKINGLKAA